MSESVLMLLWQLLGPMSLIPIFESVMSPHAWWQRTVAYAPLVGWVLGCVWLIGAMQ